LKKIGGNMVNKQTRNIFILSIVLIALFGYLDSMQIIPWQETQLWEQYNFYVMPAILGMWWIGLLGMSVMYYLIKRDKSEAIGIFISAFIILSGGTEDVFFFILSGNVMAQQMCWFTGPQTIISHLMGEACVSPIALVLNSILFIILAWYALNWFFKQKW